MRSKRAHATISEHDPAQPAPQNILPRKGGRSRQARLAEGGTQKGKSSREVVKVELDDADRAANFDKSFSARKKRKQIKSACLQCRKRKTRCSGQRPRCRSCSNRELVCSWDISEGMSRMADLKQKLQKTTEEYNDLNILVDALRSGTDMDSTMLLARLRLGTSVEDLVKPLRINTALTNSTDSQPKWCASRKLCCRAGSAGFYIWPASLHRKNRCASSG